MSIKDDYIRLSKDMEFIRKIREELERECKRMEDEYLIKEAERVVRGL